MDKFQFNLFDIFGNIIPGSLVLYSLLVVFKKVSWLIFLEPESLLEISNFDSWVIIFISSYLIGYALQVISHILYQAIKERFKLNLSFTNKGVLLSRIRHESPRNYVLIQRFMMLRILGYNMSCAISINIIGFMISAPTAFYSIYEFIIVLFFMITLALIFYKRTFDFEIYAHKVIDDSIKYLNDGK